MRLHRQVLASNITLVVITLLTHPVVTAAPPSSLIVVEDRGGISALPYYHALDPEQEDANGFRSPSVNPQVVTIDPVSEASMLPVRSMLLSPGQVVRKAIKAPGLMSLFLVGDDEHSRAWLRQRGTTLQELGAVGLVVNVATPQALAELRSEVPELKLIPTAADDMAERLGLKHYPVLITPTGIEQ
ncbi:integrating conjugative element protein [Pseudomonas sp. RC4D1]|uniref:integrating conjugative element protein n=1 Tax=Pseudomonas sp. RC4D1 TaxID=2834407 RepID=UPI001BCBEEDA|nr:integrating conjugative element protein [Pseudomonas sp. RC4D1]MBS7560150.1 integrating conjugative element protein [Pseudomonas sp. RC4D1]